ncbi:hypothetical protein Pisl_0666 [Pyrobaculum islandicum DSM 4184]|uniref:Uncharacterized protein n=1 Tax=Pyrobaculum islandicum (strain DSM 4184 / JCM 9189 / GEO3) TaxID=384616 RepID=A1RSB2_PYRIL|nr:hypothetical protein Pisl_0666 [Pyrobaculum islandicum DSM 4184]
MSCRGEARHPKPRDAYAPSGGEVCEKTVKGGRGAGRSKLTTEELDCLLTPDRRELAYKIIEETFPKYGLKQYFINQTKVFWRDAAFFRVVRSNAQLRIENKKDMSTAVFVDIFGGEYYQQCNEPEMGCNKPTIA